MNLQHFTLPALIAAAFHAVLLMSGTPATPLTLPPCNKTEMPETTQIPMEEKPEPPSDTNDPAGEVKALKGEEPPPELPEILDSRTGGIPVVYENTAGNRKIKINAGTVGPIGVPDGTTDGNSTTGHSKFTSWTFLDKTPQGRAQVPPNYPPTMRQDKREGVVMVEFDVDAKGRVFSARVRESSHRAFEEPTIRAVLKWSFEPGRRKGIPVPFRMVIPVNFTLGDK